MVVNNLPPDSPPANLKPIFYQLQIGSKIQRIYKSKRDALSFRYTDNFGRFDHILINKPHSQKGISYWGITFSSCLVEIFGDSKIITSSELQIRKVAIAILKDSLLLLDLRGNGAMRAGTNLSISASESRSTSQAWSRYFYDHPQTFNLIDGIIFPNSHNGEDAICFYERALPKLEPANIRSIDLASVALLPKIAKVCLNCGIDYLG